MKITKVFNGSAFSIALVAMLLTHSAFAGPVSKCQNALVNNCFDYIPYNILDKCKRANKYSAQAVVRYTNLICQSGEGEIGIDAFKVLLSIRTEEQLDCVNMWADLLERHGEGYIGSKFLKKRCLR